VSSFEKHAGVQRQAEEKIDFLLLHGLQDAEYSINFIFGSLRQNIMMG